MSQFTVTGRFRIRDGWQSFERETEAPNENVAVERTYAEFGSQHGLKRSHVDVREVQA